MVLPKSNVTSVYLTSMFSSLEAMCFLCRSCRFTSQQRHSRVVENGTWQHLSSPERVMTDCSGVTIM